MWYLDWLSVFWTRPLISLTVSSCISVAASVCAKPSLWKFPSFTYRAPLALILALHSRGVRMIDSSVFCRSYDLLVRCAAASWRLHRIWPLLLFPVLIFTIPVKKKKKQRQKNIANKGNDLGEVPGRGFFFFFSFYETETSIRCAAEPDVACVITGQRRREVNEGESTATCGGRRRCGWPSGGVSNDHMHIGCVSVSVCGRQI